jgi:hypothetical protein
LASEALSCVPESERVVGNDWPEKARKGVVRPTVKVTPREPVPPALLAETVKPKVPTADGVAVRTVVRF